MYARISVAADALDTTGITVGMANALHAALLNEINSHGRLIFGNGDDVLALIRAIRGGTTMPPDARKRWEETLRRLKATNRIAVLDDATVTPLTSVQAVDELRRHWGTATDVAVLAGHACSTLGIPEDPGFLSDPTQSPDIATTVATPYSPVIANINDLEARGMANHQSDREDFWTLVLQPLATQATTVTILDRYACKALWDIETRKPWARHWATEHITWLLNRLDDVMAPGGTVHVICGRLDDHPQATAETTADLIYQQWQPPATGRLHRVDLAFAEPRRMSELPHDRHIRFSTGAAIEIPAGLDRLREPRIWDPDGMRWNYRWHPAALDSLQDSEKRAAAFASEPPAPVLER